jgi:hypothetical protein
MKIDKEKALRLLIASLFGVACFGLGYLAPHARAAIAATPSPHPMFTDGTPGGFGHGLVTVQSASVPPGASKAGWPCLKTDKCTFAFQFDASETGQPDVPTCPKPHQSCLQFTGQNYAFESHGPTSYGPKSVYISGSLQFYK